MFGGGVNFLFVIGGFEVIVVDIKFLNNYFVLCGGVFFDVDLFFLGGVLGLKIY